MATTSAPPTSAPPTSAPPTSAPPTSADKPPPPAAPGGLASDPTIGAATEIVNFVMGAVARHRGESDDEIRSQIIGEVSNRIKASINQATPSKGV